MKENKEETKLQSEQRNWKDAVNKAATSFVENHKDEAVRSMFGHHFRTFVQGAIWQQEFDSKSQPLPIKGVEREWISVEERLPQESGRYWCYVVHFGELGRSSEQVNCSYSERHGFTEKLNPMNVTHWMPLPQRPQK